MHRDLCPAIAGRGEVSGLLTGTLQAALQAIDRMTLRMPFIPPMLATRLGGPRRQRAQLHVREHRTVHAFSRPGRELIGLPGARLAA